MKRVPVLTAERTGIMVSQAIMSAESVELLKRNRLLARLSEEQVRELSPGLEEERFPEGSCIMKESQRADRVYLLVEGTVMVRKRLSGTEEAEIATLEPGDFFGEMSFFADQGGRSASVYALSPVTAFSIRQSDFTTLLSRYPGVMRNILSNVVSHLLALHERYIERLRKEKGDLEREVESRTRELSKASRRISRELQVAQNIQKNLLPEKEITFPGVSILTEYVPCEELSGDIMGVFSIDERRIAIYGGDVSGHGIYAAMVMSYVKKLIEISMKRVLIKGRYVAKPPGAVLTSINKSFISEVSLGDPEIYLTLFLGILDLREFCFEYSSAGVHVPPLVYSGEAIGELFKSSDFAIGHVPDYAYGTEKTSLSPGQALFFVSDGVVEARRGEETFGMERLKAEALSMLASPGGQGLGRILAKVRGFCGDAKPDDDMCFFLMRVE